MTNHNIYIKMSNIKDVSPSERQVIDYLLDVKSKHVNNTIVEMGAKTYTSASTVTRVYKKLGCRSFSEFKRMLIQDQKSYVESTILFTKKEPILKDDDINTIIDKTTNNCINAIISVKRLNSDNTFQSVVNLMKQCQVMHFYGSGVSNLICHDAMIKALRSGCKATAYTYYTEMIMQAKLSVKSDLAFLVSYTGQTSDILKVARVLKQNDVPTVSITSNSNNELIQLCKINIFVDNTESVYRVGGMESRVSIQNALDILFSIYFSQSAKARDYIEKTFVVDTFKQTNQ